MTAISNTSCNLRAPLVDANGATDVEGSTKLVLVAIGFELVGFWPATGVTGVTELKVGTSVGVVAVGTVIEGIVNVSELEVVAIPGLWNFGLLALSR